MQTGIENNHGQRRSGFELLRILAALGVLALHYNDGGIFDGLSKQVNLLVLNLNECFWAWPVDVFLMLCGYFSYQKKRVDLKKPTMLYVQLVVFRLAGSAIGVLRSGSGLAPGKLFACFLPLNYFVVLYIAVYLISPWLNALYNGLDRDAKRRMILCLFAVFSLWAYAGDLLSAAIGLSMNFASPVSISGDISGHTVVNFALCYLIGAAIAEDADLPAKRRRLCCDLVLQPLRDAAGGLADVLLPHAGHRMREMDQHARRSESLRLSDTALSVRLLRKRALYVVAPVCTAGAYHIQPDQYLPCRFSGAYRLYRADSAGI